MIVTIGRWRLECDPETTSRLYESRELGSGCGCAYCRNFTAALPFAFPERVQQLFAKLGIDVRKPAELFDCDRDESGQRFSGGWYHFVGHILSGDDGWMQRGEVFQASFEPINADVSIEMTSRLALVPESFARQRIVQIDFHCHVPWVLDEPEPTM